MLILPAIDLLGGNAVRLKQGVERTAKVYSNKPAAMAKKWASAGAEMIHVVNLDGAFGRDNKNADAISDIVKVSDIPIELGGGIRSIDDVVQWFGLGVTRVILGTVALTNPQLVKSAVAQFGAGRIIVGIDGRNDQVAIRGWEEQTEKGVAELALEMKSAGVERIIYTDVHRDGELVGPNFASTDALAKESGLKVIASGGFSTIQHFEQLERLNNPDIEGAIIGTALYEGSIHLEELTQRFHSGREE